MKRVRKLTQFYLMKFGIRPPFKVVMDGEFLQAALEGKVRIKEQIPKLLQEQTSTFVTKCVVHDLKQKGGFYRGAAMIGDSLQHARCAHEGIIAPDECIKLLVGGGNADAFFVGAQDVELRSWVRARPGVPLLFIRGQVPILESPSDSTKAQTATDIASQSKLNAEERAALRELKPKKVPGTGTTKKKKKKKGKPEPNSLSRKKKKKNEAGAPANKKKSTAEFTPASAPAAAESGAAPTQKKTRRGGRGKKRKKTEEDDTNSGAAPAKVARAEES